MRSMLEGRLAQHTAQLAGLRRQQQESAELEVRGPSGCLYKEAAVLLPAPSLEGPPATAHNRSLAYWATGSGGITG